jgi:16S rRNA (adenine1518-N6/adenine1519-N6)-dimethyltransferase
MKPAEQNTVGVAPKKSLGQNFLTDQGKAERIVDLLEISPESIVLEIGPGTGALTRHILNRAPRHLVAVELDPRAADYMENGYGSHPAFHLHRGDFLAVGLQPALEYRASPGERICVAGNIPYNITSPILFTLFENALLIRRSVIMMQREVARRLVAVPRTKDYGILTIAAALTGKAKLEFHVPPGCFFPPPNVTSSVVSFSFSDDSAAHALWQQTQPYVRQGFNQRRKVLSNALGDIVSRHTGEPFAAHTQLESYGRRRAEELPPEEWLELALLINSISRKP